MSERPRSRSNQFFRELTPAVLKGTAAGIGLGAIGLVGTTILSHRERTHESVKLHPILTAFFELEQQTYGMDNTIWASVHRIHHHIPDATLYPYLRIYRAVQKMRASDAPNSFQYMDPYVESFSLDEVMEVGRNAEKLVAERMGDEYQPPVEYSSEELERILNPQEPQYYYPDYPRAAEKYESDEMARILLTDPHSPSLIPPVNGNLNGVRGVFKNNIALYRRPSNVFKWKPHLKPIDLQRDNDVPNKDYTPLVVSTFVALSAAAFLLRGRYTLKDALIAAAAGSAANGMRMYTGAVIGGKVTNSFGHMGEVTAKDFIDAMFKREYQIRLNPDGTVSTNTVNAGVLGKLSAYLTADEVGGQDAHHKYPENIAYTESAGMQGILDAPYGSFTAYLAKSGLAFITEGDDFGGIPKDQRPDAPNPAMKIIHSARVKEMARAA